MPLPIASLVRDRFLTLLANGGDTLDWSAIGGLPARDAGLPPKWPNNHRFSANTVMVGFEPPRSGAILL